MPLAVLLPVELQACLSSESWLGRARTAPILRPASAAPTEPAFLSEELGAAFFMLRTLLQWPS